MFLLNREVYVANRLYCTLSSHASLLPVKFLYLSDPFLYLCWCPCRMTPLWEMLEKFWFYIFTSNRYQGREGWAPASYLKKSDIQSQKQLAGAAAHASTNDLDGVSKQNQQNNATRENRDNSHKENRLSFFSDNKSMTWLSNVVNFCLSMSV